MTSAPKRDLHCDRLFIYGVARFAGGMGRATLRAAQTTCVCVWWWRGSQSRSIINLLFLCVCLVQLNKFNRNNNNKSTISICMWNESLCDCQTVQSARIYLHSLNWIVMICTERNNIIDVHEFLCSAHILNQSLHDDDDGGGGDRQSSAIQFTDRTHM